MSEPHWADEVNELFAAKDKRVAELEAALCGLYNECMAHGWNTWPMTDAMKAARALLNVSDK